MSYDKSEMHDQILPALGTSEDNSSMPVTSKKNKRNLLREENK